MRRPLFIAFEGIDGAGTTTQCDRLATYLQSEGVEVVRTREPGGSEVGERLRDLVLSPSLSIDPVTEVLLYAAARAQHVRETIGPALASGKPVLCDRYVLSSLAYQAYGRELDLQAVRRANEWAVDACSPDLTVFLKIPMEVANQRRISRGRAADRMELGGDSFLRRVAEGYEELIASESPSNTICVDATGGEEEIAKRVLGELTGEFAEFPFDHCAAVPSTTGQPAR